MGKREKPNMFSLCLPDPLDSLCQTDIVCFKFVQANSRGKSETTQKPVHE